MSWDQGCILKYQQFVFATRYMINILVYRLICTWYRETAGLEEFHFFEFHYTCANSCIYIHFICLSIVKKKKISLNQTETGHPSKFHYFNLWKKNRLPDFKIQKKHLNLFNASLYGFQNIWVFKLWITGVLNKHSEPNLSEQPSWKWTCLCIGHSPIDKPLRN